MPELETLFAPQKTTEFTNTFEYPHSLGPNKSKDEQASGAPGSYISRPRAQLPQEQQHSNGAPTLLPIFTTDTWTLPTRPYMPAVASPQQGLLLHWELVLWARLLPPSPTPPSPAFHS